MDADLSATYTEFKNLPTEHRVVKVALGVEDGMQFFLLENGDVYELNTGMYIFYCGTTASRKKKR